MRDESFSKSRLYYEGILPGNIYTLGNNAYGRVVGVRNNDEDIKGLDETQLLDVTRKIVREWGDMSNAEVDQALISAIDHPLQSLRVMSPEAVFIEPFPMMLQCRKCKVLDFHQPFLKDEERIENASKRIRNVSGKERVKCRLCDGYMVQMRYIAVHRCGYMDQLDVPFPAGRIANLGYKDQGGAFVHNAFFDVSTGEQTDHALQRKCSQCTTDYPGLDGNNKRATPVISRDKFYPQNIQYLCLQRETGELVSEVSALIGPTGEPLSPQSRDIAEGIYSCLIGIATGKELVDHMREVLSGNGPDKAALKELSESLDEKRKARNEFLKLAVSMSKEMRDSMLGAIEKEIESLQGRIAVASGRFSKVREYVDDDALLQAIASRRRSSEATLLAQDFKVHSKTHREQIQMESSPERKDLLIQEAGILRSQFGIEEIVHYKEINVVMASIGYSREKSRPADDGIAVVPVKMMGYEDRYNNSLAGKRVIYAMPAKTEAIQVRLDPCKVLNWCVEGAGWLDPGDEIMNDPVKARSYLLKMSPALSMDPYEVKAETKKSPHREAAPFHLLHTIAHCLLATVKRHTGYDEKSVMEYLMPVDLSFILYVTSVQNFTSGGLLMLFKHYLRDWFDDASNYAFSCIFDPICSDKGGSCSGCVQIVVGCETFNHQISRCYIHGGKLEPTTDMSVNQGYWS